MTLTAFDPSHTGPSAVLSSGNRICTPTDAQNCSRVTNGYNAAGGLDLWWEYLCIASDAFGNNFPCVGISPSTDTFNGNGTNGIAATMTGGYTVCDDAVSTFIGFHGGGSFSPTVLARFGGSPAGSAIGCRYNTSTGLFSIYTEDLAGTTRTLCTSFTAATTGVWFPCYGTGKNAPTTEAYQLNTANSQLHMARPAGTTAYEDAVNPASSGSKSAFFALL